MSQRRTQEAFEELVNDLTGGEYSVIGRYVDALANIYFRHNICGRIVKMRPNRFLHEGGRCKFCNKLIKKNIPLPREENRSKSIMVVDDDPIFNKICVEKLTTPTIQVDSFTNPREAIEKYKLKPYDLIILDLLMPEMDGLDVMSKIRDEFPSSKIILTSGWEGQDKALFKSILNSTKLFGSTATLHKPIDPKLLVDTVTKVLKLNTETNTPPAKTSK